MQAHEHKHMNPDAPQLWRAPRWALALLLALLGMLGPFSIDTYLPAFVGMARSLGASPVQMQMQMQQTLSGYLPAWLCFHEPVSWCHF